MDITATAHLDYVPLNEVLRLGTFVGVAGIRVTYNITDDDVFEGNETLEYIFLLYDDPPPSGNLIAGPAITTLVIVDDDAPRKYSNEKI